MRMKRFRERGSTSQGWTYAKAGVDISKVKDCHNVIAKILEKSYATHARGVGSVLYGSGHYSGLIDIGDNRALALHADGVGSKVLIAQMMNSFDTIGIDCVAMNVNDIICMGAEPIAMVDYLALKNLNPEVVIDIVRGLEKGAEEASIALVGGETAILPDVIKGIDDDGFDLAGMAIGIVEKDKIITGEDLKPGDCIIGVESSGIHSNGLSLARKVLLKRYGLHDHLSSLENTLGEELLKPTRIYVKPVLEALKEELKISGLAHITGGAFTKLKRLTRRPQIGFKIDNIPDSPEIFKLIQSEGNISEREMFRTFNMGIGFCIFASLTEADRILKIFQRYGVDAYIIGSIVDEEGVCVKGIRIE